MLPFGFDILEQAVANETVLALSVLIAGVISAKFIALTILAFNDKLNLVSIASIKSLTRLIELMIFVFFTIVALDVLKVEFANDVLVRVWDIIPAALVVILILMLGYIVINLIVDILKTFFSRIGRLDYLNEFGISSNALNTIFFVLKLFLYLVLLSITMNYYARPIPFFDTIIAGTVFTLMFFAGALIAYSFRDYIANALLARYVEKSIVKPGQRVKLKDVEGEVVSVTNHGVIIETSSGYNQIIPNSVIVTKEILVKRIRSNITKIEALMNNFTSQMPSYCGPASAVMMLDFFGYTISQEELAKESKTKVPGGTEPEDLINAVKKFTDSEVKGQLIRFDEIFDLAQEIKAWIAEGALIILWYKKPIIFPDKHSQSGHYVLCVGVEGEELVVMDPSSETAGVYLVNHQILEEAMDDYDISRGYFIFAKKGTSAFWRLNEGLLYGDVGSYKSLSKSFERYLKRQFRQRNMINEIISEHLAPKIKEEKVKHVWKPDLTSSKQKQEKEKTESEKSKEKNTNSKTSKK
ncbi:MAG: C39 family peptidase [archaeon]|nr:C39 family peptidase [archaeon]